MWFSNQQNNLKKLRLQEELRPFQDHFFHSHLFEASNSIYYISETVFWAKARRRKDAFPLTQITQLGKPDIPGTRGTRDQKHLSKASTHSNGYIMGISLYLET